MRIEYKYLVPTDVLPTLRRQIAPFMRLDRHGHGYEERGYTIRSIYLDTATLSDYEEKEAGLKNRKKIRIRGYNTVVDDSLVFLEIKHKQEWAIWKDRSLVRYRDVEAVLASGDYERFAPTPSEAMAESARRFLYHVYHRSLRSISLVVYEREAFEGLFDPTLRITFDRNLRGRLFPGLGELGCTDDLHHVTPGYFILEVKFDTHFPVWLTPIIGQHGLRKQALSKYCMCVDLEERHHTNPSVVHAENPPMPWERACPAQPNTPLPSGPVPLRARRLVPVDTTLSS